MAKYQKRPGDIQFRCVALTVNVEPDFQPITSDIISFSDDKVLEILHEDGTKILDYGGKAPIHIDIVQHMNEIGFRREIPSARLWVREVGRPNGTYYKVPMNLKEENGMKWFVLPAGMQEYELCGDKYFERVYSF